ncbi:TRPC1 family protein [Megaselia abdita]
MCIQPTLITDIWNSQNLYEGRKLHFASPARRKSVLAPILNKIKNGGEDNDKKVGESHITLQIEPAKRVKRHSIHGMMEEENIIRPHQEIRQLNLEEKKFLLAVERGDMASTRRMLEKITETGYISINCVDPLGRSALLMAIDNENLEMVELLINNNVDTKDALLHAISEEFVEAVEMLLDHEDQDQNPSNSFDSQSEDTSTFTQDINPLILAAHRNNYEIIKILLDRGWKVPQPHDVRCGCEECVKSRKEDSLRHSRSRINAYRALASPSLIALSSQDPILTAFELSWALRNLSFVEHEFKTEYQELRKQCQDFATALLDHTRTSHELAIILNYDPTGPNYEQGDRMHLNRLKLAIKLKQKKFVAHPNVQQLLASIWYDGLPGFRRKNIVCQGFDIFRIGIFFPIFSLFYIIAPGKGFGQTMRKPFIKFICHSASYFSFLFLLMLASQRIETVIGGWFVSEKDPKTLQDELPTKRGATPTTVEWLILAWVSGLIWSEVKQLWDVGVHEYLNDMWNVIDFVTNSLYVATIALRVVSYYQVKKEMYTNNNAVDLPREKWDTWDPMLLSEGLFSAANIFSSLKLVYIFSVNPHLGPLQVSLSRMVMDIMKFFFLYVLVLFAFGSGLNQLLWYYSDLEKKRCPELFNYHNMSYPLPINGTNDPNACIVWRRFSNLFETTQTLFWAVFGLIDLDSFELDGIKSFTRFWGMLMFGTYSVINIVVLLNLLIAMMNHSYQLISERADTEWKFARSKLWISYFEEGGTCPPPFNIIPTPKSIVYVFKWAKRVFCSGSSAARREHLQTIRRKQQQANDRDFKYTQIMRNLVRRYVTVEQRKAESQGVTEDDVNEIKQDISAFRCELVEILKNSGMDTNVSAAQNAGSGGKKNRQKERRLMKGFNIAPPPGSTGSLAPVQEQFSTSLDQSDQAQLTHTLQNLFSNSFLNKNKTATQSCSTNNFNSFNSSNSTTSSGKEGPPPVYEHIAGTKYNKNCLKTYNKRMSGQKKKWGNVIEAAKLSNVSKILGRSKSEDSVYNSMNSPTVQQGIKVSYAQDTGQYSSDNNSTSSVSTTLVHGVPVIHAKEDLKKKRKKFSSSKNISPVTESISISPETDKALKRVSSYPACPSTETKEIAKPRRHEQTQSQHESVETTSEYTISSNELPLDPSSREPLLNAIIANH